MIRVLGIYFFDTSTKVVVFAGQEAEQLHSLTQTKVGPIRLEVANQDVVSSIHEIQLCITK